MGKLGALIILVSMIMGIVVFSYNVQVTRANGTIYIGADGTIFPPAASITTVDNLTYTFVGNINASIVVQRNGIVVDGNGYSLQGPGTGIGFSLSGVTNVVIENTTVADFADGIWLNYSSGNTLSGNNVADNVAGICLRSSPGNTLSGNVMVGNGYNFDVEGSVLSDFLQSVDTSNLVDGKPVYYFVNQSGLVVDDAAYPEVGYLGFVNCVNVTVQGLNLTDIGHGFLLAFTNDSKITANNIANSLYGLVLSSSSNNTLSGNNVEANIPYGLVLSSSSNNTLSGNNITNSSEGLLLNYSSGNTLSGNNITNNMYGVDLTSSPDSTLSGNNITYTDFGIWLEVSSNSTLSGNSFAYNGIGVFLESSSSNTLSGNSVTANHGYGIWLEGISNSTLSDNNITANGGYGTGLEYSFYNLLYGNNFMANDGGVWLQSSSNNSVFHNSFVNNTIQIQTERSNNTWDDDFPSGGNFWSDYNGSDSNHDGIGDSNYTIDAGNVDRYPLMGMFKRFSASPEQSVETICNSTISGFVFNGTAVSFDVYGASGATGFCRICIPTALMDANYRVFVDGTEVAYTLLPFSNSTHKYLYFSYTNSSRQVTVIPEFPKLTILLPVIFITLSSLTILSVKNRNRKGCSSIKNDKILKYKYNSNVRVCEIGVKWAAFIPCIL